MNLTYSLFVALFIYPHFCFSQGNITQNRSSPDFSKSKVIQEVSYEEGGRTITFKEIEPPIRRNKEPNPVNPISQSPSKSSASEFPIISLFTQDAFTVIATTYDDRITKLSITSHTEGETLEAWSNVNWNHLTPVSSLTVEKEVYSMLLLQSNASLKELRKARKRDKTIQVPKVPNNLPKLKKGGPRYTISQAPTSGQETILDFLEAIHDHYALKKKALATSYKERKEQLAKEKKELEENPPQPEDLEIIFWNNDSNR